MILLSGADVVLPGEVLRSGTVVLDGERIVDVVGGVRSGGAGDLHIDCSGDYVVPGFIDVHVHGVEGFDTLTGKDGIASMAARFPAHGVTGFCPTSIACDPGALSRMLDAVRRARTTDSEGARVLPAHLESNFINPEFKGAQPLDCLRSPRGERSEGTFSGRDILDTIAAARPDVGIITIAPELDGAIDLIVDLVRDGHIVSLGHSGASYEQALAGIAAGARQATHLFNRMPPVAHRAPGLAGAVLEHDEIAAELVCDGIHVHPAMMKVALAAKRPERVLAITDGTAGSGLPYGSTSTIGGRPIVVREAAYLEDGTLAGSALTMHRAFALLVEKVGMSLPDAAVVCSTTPARELGLQGLGVIAPGAIADVVVLDRNFTVRQTYIAGRLAYEGSPGS
jgi:N-acetylglucosamine-6-phosphate deacetylase